MHELDHVFVFCHPNAPEAARLEAIGLRVGIRRRHAGQGTANVCFQFSNAYLELLWVEDERAARSAQVQPLGLWERSRWRDDAASPFGVCVRPAGEIEDPPFPHWQFTPPYLPRGEAIRVAGNCGVRAEPLLFELRRPYDPPREQHPWSEHRVTGIRIAVPGLTPASPLRSLPVPDLEFLPGDDHLLDLAIGPAPYHVHDLRPDLPLVLRC